MDICACMQTYILYINTKCASGVCTQDANGIDRFTIIKSTYLEKIKEKELENGEKREKNKEIRGELSIDLMQIG